MNISLGMLSKKLILVIALLFSVVLVAQVEEKEYTNFQPIAITSLPYNPTTTFYGGVNRVFDSEASLPNQNNLNIYSYLSLHIDNNLAPFVRYKLIATFNIILLNQKGVQEGAPIEKELEVSYNPSQASSSGSNFSDLSYLKIENRFGIEVQLKSYKVLNELDKPLAIVPNNAFVSMGVKGKRFYTVSQQLPSPKATINSSQTAITLGWDTINGAVEYELEWTWIDNYGTESASDLLAPEGINFSERDFELNNTRIITSKSNYEIPLIYSKGYLIYRVRAIGRYNNSEFSKYYGGWSSGTNTKITVADWPHQSTIAEHEGDKNWQFQASYAEDGKKKEVVSYFDGSLRNRQTVTKINTDNTTVVGEVIYDAQGRAAIEVLPTPTIDNTIHYFKNYNLNLNNKIYSYKDFDLDGSSCASQTSEMSTVSGSSKYYSPAGFADFSTRTNQAYVPDAKSYPFSQIEYTSDNTGRIARKGGVGIDHMLGKGHEMKYFYTTPTDKELHRLFGYSVGDVLRYKKNIVVDPNNQVSVSYLDPQGRTIATALSGGKPTNLEGLLEENVANTANGHGEINLDLLNKTNIDDFDTPFDNNFEQSTGIFPMINDKLSLSKQIVVSGNSVSHKFEYSLNQPFSFSPLYCATGLYPFVYDVKLSLKDDCGNEKLNSPLIWDTTEATSSVGGGNMPVNFTHSATTTLNTGTYSLSKEIKVNDKVLNEYADQYIAKLKDPENKECYKDPAVIFNPNTQLEFDTCNVTCASCTESIGTKLVYVQKAFDAFYKSKVVTVSLTPSAPNANTTILLTPNSVDVFGSLINLSEVDALNIRFNREWVLLSQECNKICNPTLIEFETNCLINESMLMSDFKPNGQYGATNVYSYDASGKVMLDAAGNPVPNPDFDKLSIFNSQGNLFYYNSATGTSTTSDNNWKRPIGDYKDEYGVKSLIEVKLVDGVFIPRVNPNFTPVLSNQLAPDGSEIRQIEPEQLLDVKDFIRLWQDSWALSLLPYHPEYNYLEYSKDLCNRTNNFPITKNVEGVITDQPETPLSSDGYDSYILNTDTYLDARAKGFIDFELGDTGKLQIYSADPFFKQLPSQYEDARLYGIRVGSNSIMERAIKISYISSDDVPTNNLATNLTMYQVAIKGVRCNSFSECNIANNFDFTTLSPSEKDEVWKIYRSLYIGLKGKIKHVFINIHALKNKSFNGCIGTSGSSTITDVLGNNFPQKAILNSYIQDNTSTAGSLCESTSALLYQKKQKLFLPSDFGYDATINPTQAVNNMVQANHFEYYAQTGNCPLLFDFDVLLNGLFKDNLLSSTVAITDVNFNKQYITKELFKKLMKSSTALSVDQLFEAGLKPVTITTSVSGPTLTIGFKSKPIGDFTTCPITIVLPSTGNTTWANYGSTWKIINLKQLYYDLVNSDATRGVFTYQVVAEIGNALNNTTNVISGEIVLTGQTCAPIGECGIGATIGEVLDPNQATNDQGVGCNRKYKFEKALVAFLNELKVPSPAHPTAMFASTTGVNLNNYATYKNSFLAEFFNENTTTSLSTIWIRNDYEFSLKRGSEVLATFNLPLPQSLLKFESVTISDLNNTNSLKVNSRLIDGTTQLTNGFISPKLNFDCCPIKNPWANDLDHDGVVDSLDNCPTTPNTDQADVNPANGVGDVCENNPCLQKTSICDENNSVAEADFETGLLNVLRQTLQDNLITFGDTNFRDCASYAAMNSFITNSNLVSRFQALRNTINPNTGLAPVDLNKFSVRFAGTSPIVYIDFLNSNGTIDASISMDTPYVEGAVNRDVTQFNCLDIVGDNSVSITITSKDNKQYTRIAAGFGYSVNTRGTPSSVNSNFCSFLSQNYSGNPSNGLVVACNLSQQEEAKFEFNIRDAFNEGISSDFAIYQENSSSNIAVNYFINDSRLISHFQKLRDYFASIDPSNAYNRIVNLSKFRFLKGGGDGQLIMEFYDANGSLSAGFYLMTPNISSISRIRTIDFIESSSNNVMVSYSDRNGLTKSVTAYFNYYIALTPNSGSSVNYCKFFAEDYPQSSMVLKSFDNETPIAIATFNVDAFGVHTMLPSTNRQASARLAIESEPQTCSTCIPQTVAPIACDSKKATFIAKMNNRIPDYTVPQATLDNFCNDGYQYISESYLYYLTTLGVTQLYDVRFRTLSQFGDTYLNFGFNGIVSVINQYKEYYDGNVNNPEVLNWNQWVETVFRKSDVGKRICPPARLSTLVSPDLPVDTEPTCQHMVTNIKEAFLQDNYNNYLIARRNEFIADYIKKAMTTVNEKLSMTYYDQEYQYTLYYYDQAGNLTQTVAPEGVKRFSPTDIDAKNKDIETFKLNNRPLNTKPLGDDPALQPAHTFKTQYRYNSLNQLVWQSTPDGGETRFAYDRLGRIIASQNAKQAFPFGSKPNLFVKFSYTKYDLLGRIKEAGETVSPLNAGEYDGAYSISVEGKLIVSLSGRKGLTSSIVDEFSEQQTKNQVTRTIYDEDPEYETNLKASALFTTNTTAGFDAAFNNRNRVTGVFYHENYNTSTPLVYDNAIFYNYDVHGNVKELVNYYTPLKVANCVATDTINNVTKQLNDCEAHIKRVVYNYDLISGNVNNVTFQPNKPDQFKHRYNYDADNRIVNVETSDDGVIWEKDASYEYYAHGPLARVELGNKQVQGIDYAYTLQGWLKTVNGENIAESQNDLGNDGSSSPTSTRKTKDAFGYSLNYYEGDYKAISDYTGDASFKPLMVSRNTTGTSLENLYNGNIKQMTTAIRKSGDKLLDIQKNNYTYDQLNRIKKMTSFAFNPATMISKASYHSNYEYDRNGNLQELNRWAPQKNDSIEIMDRLVYDYEKDANGKIVNNKLGLVKDLAPAASSPLFDNDLENQITQLTALGLPYDIQDLQHQKQNYIYDAIGQLIEDKSEGLKIDWRVDGKVKQVTNSKSGTIISFDYDGLGNRIAKNVQKDAKITRTLYSRDAQGNVLAVYQENLNVPTTAVVPNLYLNNYTVSTTQIKKATNGIYVSSDGSPTTVTPTGNLNAIAANEIVLSPGFIVTAGSTFKAEIAPVTVDNQSTFVLKEHHIYGSSRLGVQENDLLLYKYIVPSLLNKSARIASKTALTLISPSVLSGVPVFRDYSLQFTPSTTATWPMQSSTSTAVDPDLANLYLETKLKLANPAALANGEYAIGQLQFKGTKSIDVYEPISLANQWSYVVDNSGNTNTCVGFSDYNDYVLRIAKNCPNYSQKITYTYNNAISANQKGYVTYQLPTYRESNDIVVGFKIGNEYFTILSQYQSGDDISISTGYSEGYPQYHNIGATSQLKIQRDEHNIIFSVNGSILRTIPAESFNLPAIPFVIFGSTPANIKQRITNFSVYAAVSINKEITNQVALSVQKTATGYTPKTTVTQYLRDTTTNTTTKRSYSLIAANSVTASQIAAGLDMNLNASFANNTGSFIVNGIEQSILPTWTDNGTVATTTIPAVATVGANQLGGAIAGATATAFDMCYFNYGINNNNNTFTFDDVTSETVTTNLPEATNGSTMTVTPAVVRILGPCLPDTDADGIYDLYEVNADLSFIDTDGDGIANHEDPDDDGDGILTQYEEPDPDGDHNPATGTPSLNTNGVAATDNPTATINNIPNYLDVDDDGDGYATWETYEGGPGSVNAPTTAYVYTLNSDSDPVVNYLDPTNGNYPESLVSTNKIYVSLVGDKRYELANHLGNVLVVINDKKIPALSTNGTVLNYFNADVLSYSDYYPFGSLVPNRHGSSTAYRYGFQGQEKDDELKGEGNSLNYTYRMHDPRIGRFFARDPLEAKYPFYSPYQFSSNSPIASIELEGLESSDIKSEVEKSEPTIDYKSGNETTPTNLDEIYVTNRTGAKIMNAVQDIAVSVLTPVAETSRDLVGMFTGASSFSDDLNNSYDARYAPSTDGRYALAIAALPLIEFVPAIGAGYEAYCGWYTGTALSSSISSVGYYSTFRAGFALNSGRTALFNGLSNATGQVAYNGGFDDFNFLQPLFAAAFSKPFVSNLGESYFSLTKEEGYKTNSPFSRNFLSTFGSNYVGGKIGAQFEATLGYIPMQNVYDFTTGGAVETYENKIGDNMGTIYDKIKENTNGE